MQISNNNWRKINEKEKVEISGGGFLAGFALVVGGIMATCVAITFVVNSINATKAKIKVKDWVDASWEKNQEEIDQKSEIENAVDKKIDSMREDIVEDISNDIKSDLEFINDFYD